jgi:outer membrane protein TolC
LHAAHAADANVQHESAATPSAPHDAPTPSARRAPTATADPVLEQLIAQSLAARPEIASARANVQVERERVTQAGAWPDPMLQVGIQNDGFTSIEVGRMPTSYYSLMASQTIPWPGKLGLRQDVLDSGAKQATCSVARARLSTEAQVRRAYLGLLLARDRLEILARLQRVWARSFEIARARYEAGQGVLSDVLRSQLELQRLKQRRLTLDVEERLQIQQLNRLRAHPLLEPIATSLHVRDLPEVKASDESLRLAVARELSPELASARLRVAQNDKAMALAKKSYYPDLTVSAGIMYRGTMMPPMWLLTVGAPVPIFSGSKQSRAVAESESRLKATHLDSDEIEQVLRLRVQERQATIAALEDTARLYRTGLLEQSALTIDNTLAQYVVGRVALAAVLEANAGYLADEESYLQILADAQLVKIAAGEISLEPTATSSTPAMKTQGMASSASNGSVNGSSSAPSAM